MEENLANSHLFDDWKMTENSSSFQIENGHIVVAGAPGYLFYTGKEKEPKKFKNFELKVEVLTHAGACSGIYFHTEFQPRGVLRSGFKVQIDNTYASEDNERDCRKTGSLYGIRNIYKAIVKDDEWFELCVQVRDKQVEIWLNNILIVDYFEPASAIEGLPMLSQEGGVLALESCGGQQPVYFRNIIVKPLPDDLKTPPQNLPQVDEVYRQLLQMNQQGFPVVDYHVHLKGGMTLEEALEKSRHLGIMYAISVNGGLKFPITTDDGVIDFLAHTRGAPIFVAFQAEGREWVNMFSQEMIAKFDFVFTDCMTFTSDDGVRLRLWIPEEMTEIADPEQFMDMLVNRIVGILDNEPIDIYVNPTFLPDVLLPDYDRLWTPERCERIIQAAKANDVAIEISNLYKLPRLAFIRRAKEVGVKFSFGSNNSDANFGRLEYPLEMIRKCQLTWQDVFIPKPEGRKAAQRKKQSFLK